VPLGSHWLAGAGPASPHGLVFLGIFALLAGLSWLTVWLGRLMTPAAAGPAGTSTARAGTAGTGTAGTGTAGTGTAGTGAPGALMRVLPYTTVVIAAFLPLAAGLYLLASTGWALAERAFFWRTGRLTLPPPAAQAPRKAAVKPWRVRRR
jgi:YidC/Oxa1 family membrane protein insertase